VRAAKATALWRRFRHYGGYSTWVFQQLFLALRFGARGSNSCVCSGGWRQACMDAARLFYYGWSGGRCGGWRLAGACRR